jgi:hypothetical protein
VPTPLRLELRRLADGDLEASLGHVTSELPSTPAYLSGPDGRVRSHVLRPHARGRSATPTAGLSPPSRELPGRRSTP